MEEHKPTEIKDLNKTQLILLAILLSFVTSIVTGITTVSLMEQAPSGVTQTINKVVERTIQTVVPEYTPSTTQTVVVKEDDLVVDAVAKTRANFALVHASKESTVDLADAYSAGNGLFVAMLGGAPANTYVLKFSGNDYDAKVVGTSSLGFSLLSISSESAKTFPKPSFAKDAGAVPGKTAVLVNAESIRKGIIQSVTPKEEKDTDGKTLSYWNVISLEPAPTASMAGSFMVDLDGNVSGMVLQKGDGSIQTVGVGVITRFISDMAKSSS